MDKASFLSDYKQLKGLYERKAYKLFKVALKAQIEPLMAYLGNYGVPSDSLVNILVTKKPMESAYKEVYTTIGTKHAAWTYKQINAAGRAMKSISFFSEAWRKLMEQFFLNYSSERISDVTDTTRERIKNLLANNQDLTTSQIASLLEDEEFTRARALMIARTESTAVANYGASLGNNDADYETDAQWLSVMDSHTRPDHIEADGQVAVDGLFTIGGFTCRFPGDMSLPASEVIQCRCTTLYVPRQDADGLPILK